MISDGLHPTRHYYQRVGTLDSVQRDTLGKRIVDPHNGRVFVYVKQVEATVKPVKGAPLARIGKGFASAYQVIADFSSLNFENCMGINVASTASTGHYYWLLQEGPLGQDSQSRVYSATAYCYVCTGVAAGDNLYWKNDNSVAGGGRATFDCLQAALSALGSGANKADSFGSTVASQILYKIGAVGILGRAFSTDISSKLTMGFIKAPLS